MAKPTWTKHVVADLRLGRVGQADFLDDAAELDLAHRQVVLLVDFQHFAGDAETHAYRILAVVCGGDQDLAQGDAAVAGRHLLMSIHLKAGFRQPLRGRAPSTARSGNSRRSSTTCGQPSAFGAATATAMSARALWNRAAIVGRPARRRSRSARPRGSAAPSRRRPDRRPVIAQRQRVGASRSFGSAANSRAIAAWPSKLITGRQSAQRGHGVEQPAHAAGPREQPRPRHRRRAAYRNSSRREPRGGIVGGAPSPKISNSRPRAERRGSRAARSPPGRGNVRRWATRRKLGSLAQQHFAAPDRAVGPVAGAVPGETQHRPVQAVLGHAGRDVGVVVLDRHQRHVPSGGQAARRAASRRSRVQVAGHGFRRRRRRTRTRSSIARRWTSTLSDVSRSPMCGVMTTDAPRLRRHGVLQMPADGQDRGQFAAQTRIGSGA